MRYYCEEKERVLNELGSSESGLSEQEAQARLERNGKNRLEAAKGKSLFRRFMEQLADPMIIILIVAAVISGALSVYHITQGEEGEFVDVIIIIAVVLINAVLGVLQERPCLMLSTRTHIILRTETNGIPRHLIPPPRWHLPKIPVPTPKAVNPQWLSQPKHVLQRRLPL